MAHRRISLSQWTMAQTGCAGVPTPLTTCPHTTTSTRASPRSAIARRYVSGPRFARASSTLRRSTEAAAKFGRGQEASVPALFLRSRRRAFGRGESTLTSWTAAGTGLAVAPLLQMTPPSTMCSTLTCPHSRIAKPYVRQRLFALGSSTARNTTAAAARSGPGQVGSAPPRRPMVQYAFDLARQRSSSSPLMAVTTAYAEAKASTTTPHCIMCSTPALHC
mmetsp:Transcript_82199/g.228065  ORF Transcript_82199/g.228065 Transcript_82199/m.228065 type:complete len:220 (+) Transcript_82199:832-1491(+)